MRVIAGSLKGRQLKAPTWEGLRPTSDKLRGTIFNILAPRIAGARVLDAYAGTGAVGIEALSRGAASATFVDDDRRAQKLIEANLARCGIANGYVIIRASVARALETLDRSQPFDIMILDPPYARRARESPLERGARDLEGVIAAAGELLAADGVLVLEHQRGAAVPLAAGRLVRTRAVAAGDSALAFYACRP